MSLEERVCNSGLIMRHRKGFTLVEVIVVLVILAILAAIAIPALTGYIDKAEDKKYIADARNRIVALRAVLNEAYSEGMFSEGNALKYFLNGETSELHSEGTWHEHKTKVFRSSYLGDVSVNGSALIYNRQASELIGESFPPDGFDIATNAYWSANLLAEKPSDATALSADGFYYTYFPEGFDTNKEFEIVVVTYRIPHLTNNGIFGGGGNFSSALKNAMYDVNAGYEVYHMKFE
jgi:prepilin-type N-terminal cleavage/methylation domain-containing protein